ncbi:DNA polymerase III subunit delta [Tersicoccus solisilvae]|uniref:DNA-directed DNA polymerase n=1 Tax=Tersicoccus solisilvae TaxID=1882339 RepID=A0ABQ1NQE3_9MICC|nr:DNA polymerase III subunit delta [Tersicoccus solisilvae]GGC82851.1 DNA polymerase III subunit delta [Tersicoccus solisilvae]
MAARSTTASRGRAPALVPWREAAAAPVVLLSGAEDLLAQRARLRIRAQLRENGADLQVQQLDASTYAAGQLTMVASPSLFGETILLEVGGLAAMTDDFLTDALAYVADPEPEVFLVLWHAGGNRGKKLLDALRAAGVPTIDCQPLKRDSDKMDFVTGEFRAARRRIEVDAVRALVNAVGSSLPELAGACEQLVSDTETTVDADTVERYYGGRVEATAFKVADAALSGNSVRALATLRHAFATGVDPVPLVAALAMKVRAVAKVYGVRGSSQALAGQLSMAPWQIDQARREASRFTEEHLAAALTALAAADAQVKGESRDPEYAVESAVMLIAAGRA